MSAKQKRKEVEMQKDLLELEKAQLELEVARMDAAVLNRKYQEMHVFDPKARGTFRLDTQVNNASTRKVLSEVERFAYLNDGAAITLYLDSPGGDLIAGLGFFDGLRAIAMDHHHLTTVVRGYAASMAAVILQAGDVRLIGPESILMLHEVSSLTFGKLHEMEDDVKRTAMLNKRICEILARRAGRKWTADSLYKKIRATDWWLTAEETVANKFADDIG